MMILKHILKTHLLLILKQIHVDIVIVYIKELKMEKVIYELELML